MKEPTRVLVVEDIEAWVATLSRAAVRAGASEVVVCESLTMVKDALRRARFDVAILDIGLDPADDYNADGIKVLEAIRKKDGGGTRCILVTGWQGDRMDLQAGAQRKYGVDWAFMKEKYESRAVIARLAELLQEAPAHRLFLPAPIANLSARMEPDQFESWLLDVISPVGGMQTISSAVRGLISSAIPLVSMRPGSPMKANRDGVLVGVYWSRALAAAVAIGLASADSPARDEGNPVVDLTPFVTTRVTPDLIEHVSEHNVLGWLWELPELDRDDFADE